MESCVSVCVRVCMFVLGKAFFGDRLALLNDGCGRRTEEGIYSILFSSVFGLGHPKRERKYEME